MNHFIALLINMKTDCEYRARVRETEKELRRLSPHELHDIGLAYGDIHSVAHKSYKRPAKVTAASVIPAVLVNENLKGSV